MPAKKRVTSRTTKKELPVLLSPKLIEAQGKSDREFLTHRVKLLLDAKKRFPHESISEIAKLADLTSCGQGCCCCCNTLVIPGSEVSIPNR